jgi:hypothetical protein
MTGFVLPPDAQRVLSEMTTAESQLIRLRDQALAALAEAEREQNQSRESHEKRLREYQRGLMAEVERARADVEQRRAALDALIADRVDGFEFIASAWADYEEALADAEAAVLKTKSRPAPGAAQQVSAKGKQLAEMRRRAKRGEWLVKFYEWHVPWLTELRDLEEERSYVEDGDAGAASAEREQDPAANFLSKEEYAALSVTERNQRALDRYAAARKSNWQVGRDYERYIGYLRERAGFAVTYHGIFQGLEDLGRDLIAERGGEIEVIQCKRWSQQKTIHEKHIFQLLGTVLACRLENPGKLVRGTFTTTTHLSDRARQFASMLDIKVEESVPMADYPRIKCNVGRDGELIYHLPFDQQYDTTVIEPARGERYAMTVADAEALGFRRAWKWKGRAAAK